jgi:hypothetical protein
LAMLGIGMSEVNDDNIGVRILNLWTCEDEVITPPPSRNPRHPNYVNWWYDFECDFPKIPFHVWLLEEMIATAQAAEQQDVMRRFSALLRDLRRKQLLEWPVPVPLVEDED